MSDETSATPLLGSHGSFNVDEAAAADEPTIEEAAEPPVPTSHEGRTFRATSSDDGANIAASLQQRESVNSDYMSVQQRESVNSDYMSVQQRESVNSDNMDYLDYRENWGGAEVSPLCRWLIVAILLISPLYDLVMNSNCLGQCPPPVCSIKSGVRFNLLDEKYDLGKLSLQNETCCQTCARTESCLFFTCLKDPSGNSCSDECQMLSAIVNTSLIAGGAAWDVDERYMSGQYSSYFDRPEFSWEVAWRATLNFSNSAVTSGLTILLWFTYLRNVLIESDDERNQAALEGRVPNGEHTVGDLNSDQTPASTTSVFSKFRSLFAKVPAHAIVISCAIFLNQVIQHSMYEEYAQRQDYALLRLVNSSIPYKSNFGFPRDGSIENDTPALYYFQFVGLALTAFKYIIFITGIDAVRGRFKNLCTNLENVIEAYVSDVRQPDMRLVRALVRASEGQNNLLPCAKKAIRTATHYQKNVLFSTILGQAFVIIVSTSLYVYERLGSSYDDPEWRQSDYDSRDHWTLEKCDEWSPDWRDSTRCVLVWGIFATDLIGYSLLLGPCVYGLWVATRFNRAVSNFVTALAMKFDEEENEDAVGYLNRLDQFGMLFIAPFGFKMTDANLLQVGVFSAVSLAVARVIARYT
eukprot:SAG31_NODE_800_length_12014_cov_11.050608_2_plen_637_part_00